jgi:hypothetical protein
MRRNCWEVLSCGRESNGIHTDQAGVCPAATEWALHGINGGLNGGRACWAIKATRCQVRSTSGLEGCRDCTFSQLVREEEGAGFQDLLGLFGSGSASH